MFKAINRHMRYIKWEAFKFILNLGQDMLSKGKLIFNNPRSSIKPGSALNPKFLMPSFQKGN